MQIITYLPSCSWIQLLVLVKATCGNGFKCALQNVIEQWCSQTFDWSDKKNGYLALVMNIKIFIK